MKSIKFIAKVPRYSHIVVEAIIKNTSNAILLEEFDNFLLRNELTFLFLFTRMLSNKAQCIMEVFDDEKTSKFKRMNCSFDSREALIAEIKEFQAYCASKIEIDEINLTV